MLSRHQRLCYKFLLHYKLNLTSTKTIGFTTTATTIFKMEDNRKTKSQKKSLALFNQTFNDMIFDLTKEPVMADSRLSKVCQWYKESLHYNILGGKQNRGLIAVDSYRTLTDDSGPDLKLACIVGWCIEIVQAFFLVIDDLQDQSPTRRGKPAWYKVTKDYPDGRVGEVALVAINDGLMLQFGALQVLCKYFKDKSYYTDLIDLFTLTLHQTTLGQGMDLLNEFHQSEKAKIPFSTDDYSGIIQYKTSYYSFCLPVRSALYLAGISDPEIHQQAEAVLLKIGAFFQIQDDFIDCFGDPEVTGKIGTDIQDGKCTWMITTAKQHASEQQMKVLDDNYGKQDDGCVREVKQVYTDLDLQGLYAAVEKKSYSSIVDYVAKEVKDERVAKVLLDCLELIHCRKR